MTRHIFYKSIFFVRIRWIGLDLSVVRLVEEEQNKSNCCARRRCQRKTLLAKDIWQQPLLAAWGHGGRRTSIAWVLWQRRDVGRTAGRAAGVRQAKKIMHLIVKGEYTSRASLGVVQNARRGEYTRTMRPGGVRTMSRGDVVRALGL